VLDGSGGGLGREAMGTGGGDGGVVLAGRTGWADCRGGGSHRRGVVASEAWGLGGFGGGVSSSSSASSPLLLMLEDDTIPIAVGLRGGSRGGSGGSEVVLAGVSFWSVPFVAPLLPLSTVCTENASFPFHAGGNDRTLLSEVLLVFLAGNLGGGALDTEDGAIDGSGAVTTRLTAAGG